MPRSSLSVFVASAILALSLVAGPVPALGQSRMDVKRSMLLVNQEIELLKATVEANFASVEDAQATSEAQQARLMELERELEALKAQQNKMAITEREMGTRVEAMGREVDEKLSRFSLDGQLRFRGAYEANRTDFSSETEDNDLYVTQRLLLNLGFRVAKGVDLITQIQDARIWGASGGSVAGERSELSFSQAYVQLSSLLDGLTIDAGRMILDYGQGRMIGADDWSNTGNSFDGLRIRYAPLDGMTIDALYTIVNERDIFDGNDATLSGLYGSWEILKDFFTDAYVLHLYDGLDARYVNVATIGVAAHGTLFDALYVDVEGAVQVGRAAETQTLMRNDHLATAGYAELGYTHQRGPVPFRAGLFASGASGDAEPRDVPGNDASVSFIPLFPSRHLYWGAMDQVTWTNIRNFGLRGEVSPMPDMMIELQIHELYTADERAALPGVGLTNSVPLDAMGTHIGHEVDLRVGLKPATWATIDFGYSVFLAEEAGRNYKGLAESNAAHWLWVQTGLVF
jgi:hypothetical protein